MSYSKRQPIYKNYESLVGEIIKDKKFKSYAVQEINALEGDLLQAFKIIRERLLLTKEWPKEHLP